MSHVIHCDGGCGATTGDPKEFELVGHVIKREYCPECAGKAKEYMAAMDTLQEQIQDMWKSRAKKIKKDHKKRLEMLPDDVD